MRPRWKKVLADLWDNKARTGLVIASIYIGVFAVGQIAVGYLVLIRGITTSYLSASPANIRLVTLPFDEDLVESIQELPEVQAATGRRSFPALTRMAGDAEWHEMEVIALQSFEDQRIKKLTPRAGASAPAEKEILLLEETLADLEGEIGETLEVRLADNSIRRLRVAGTVKDYSMGLENITNPNYGFIRRDDLPYLHAPDNFDVLFVRVAGDQNDLGYIQEVANKVVKKVEKSGRIVFRTAISRANAHPYSNYINAVIGIFGLLGVFTMILSSSLIANTMNSLMAQQIRMIGIMKLVGGSRRQIVTIYITLVFVFGLISLLAAIPSAAYVGMAISSQVAGILNGRLIETSRVPMIPEVIALQALVALIMPVGAALWPVLSGARVSVQEAFHSDMIQSGGVPDAIARGFQRLPWMRGVLLLALRNTFRKTGRLALTLFTLAVGGAIFIAVYNVQLSLDQQVQRIINYSSADVFLQMQWPYRIKEIEQIVLQVPGVTGVEAWRTVGAKLKLPGEREEVVTFFGPPEDSVLVDPVAQVGRWVLPGEQNAIVVNETFWNVYPSLQPGDRVTLEINGQDTEWTVVGVFQYSGVDQFIAYTNFEALSRVLHDRTHAASYRLITEQHDVDYQLARAREIDRLLSDRGYAVAHTTALYDRVEEATDKLNLVIFVLLILAVLTGLVGAIGLSGTLSLNVLERTREIGILRAIGAYDTVVARLVLVEGLAIGVASYGLGILASFPITKLLGDVVNQAIFGVTGKFVVAPRGFLIWLACVLLFSMVASLVPARNATRLTIREVLAYE